MLMLCSDACIGCIIPRVEGFRENSGENPDFKTLYLPPLVQFKNQEKFGDEFKSKVVDLVKMYNFGVLSF